MSAVDTIGSSCCKLECKGTDYTCACRACEAKEKK